MADQDTGTAQDAAQTNTSGQANGEGSGTQDNGNGGDKGSGSGNNSPFANYNEQQINSWMGRLVKKHIEEAIAPLVRQSQVAAQQPPSGQDDALKKLNEDVTNKLFSGDAVGAMSLVMDVKEKARQTISENQNLNLMRGMTTFSDKPDYEDIQPDMQKLARDKVSKGWPVQAALESSYAEARLTYLDRKLTGGEKEHGNLNLSGGGRQSQRQKTDKLPPEFEKACARDIADGIYKDRASWIKGLNPKVRERIGL
jgi:hypothetical protein